MKPIDADKILEIHELETKLISKDWTIDDLVATIEYAPTIPSIPIEWLREKIKEHTDEEGWQDYLANSFGLCIEEWQKEQEAR